MVTISRSVGSGTGPDTVAPLRLSGLNDLLRRRVDKGVIVALESDSELFLNCCHLFFLLKEFRGTYTEVFP